MYGNRYGCMMASFTLLEDGKGDLRLKRQALQLQGSDAEAVGERGGLARPRPLIQLVERDDGAFRHQRHEPLQRASRRLVQIEIQVEQRDDQVTVPIEVVGNRRQCVAFDELDLRNVSERPVAIEDRRALLDVVERVR